MKNTNSHHHDVSSRVFEKLPALKLKKPLFVGVKKELLSKLTEFGFNKAEIELFTVRYFSSYRYLMNMFVGKQRFDLDGHEVAECTTVEKAHSAKKFIKSLKKIKAESEMTKRLKNISLEIISQHELEKKENKKKKKRAYRMRKRERDLLTAFENVPTISRNSQLLTLTLFGCGSGEAFFIGPGEVGEKTSACLVELIDKGMIKKEAVVNGFKYTPLEIIGIPKNNYEVQSENEDFIAGKS